MKKALLEASLALSLLTIFCLGAFSIKEQPIEEPAYQELSTSEENTRKEEKEFIEPIQEETQMKPIQEEFVWPLCWEIQCGDA